MTSRSKVLIWSLTVAITASCGNNGSDTRDATAAGDGQAIDAPPAEPFGSTCTNIGSPCSQKDPGGYDLVCVAPEGGTPGQGYCTRKCTDIGPECYDVPNAQWAQCLLQSKETDAGAGDKFCAFLCKSQERTWSCPSGLRCGTGDTQAICVP